VARPITFLSDYGTDDEFAGVCRAVIARIAPGAPVIDERTGVIIGIHTFLPSRGNNMITMNDWLEATLRTEIQAKKEADSG
jgi:hypothetical protein